MIPLKAWLALAVLAAGAALVTYARYDAVRDARAADRLKRAEESIEDKEDAQNRSEAIRRLTDCQLERDALERLSGIDAGDAFERCRAQSAQGQAGNSDLSGPQ